MTFLKIIITALLTLPNFILGAADKIVFLDVGQGDSILLQNGLQQVLIDGGTGMAVLSRLAEEMPWFDRRVDVVIVTHPQQDHMEGLLHVLERYDVGLVILPRWPAPSLLQDTWLKKIAATHTPYRFAWQGQRLQVGDMDLHILYPSDQPVVLAAARANLNNGAIVTRLDYHDLPVLLTADIERPVEHMLLESEQAGSLDVDVLKVGHHGSKTSTTQEFLDRTSPQLAAISVGANNRYGHPSPVVLSRLSKLPVFRTDQNGSVRLMYWQGDWYIGCSRAQLFFGMKSCIKTI